MSKIICVNLTLSIEIEDEELAEHHPDDDPAYRAFVNRLHAIPGHCDHNVHHHLVEEGD